MQPPKMRKPPVEKNTITISLPVQPKPTADPMRQQAQQQFALELFLVAVVVAVIFWVMTLIEPGTQ